MACLSLLCLAALVFLRALDGVQATCGTAGRFGRDCHLDCNCAGTCSSVSGACSGTCLAGFTGPSCQKQNVALRKGVQASSTYTTDWSAEKAVDGNTNQDASLNSCFHSDILQTSASWSVELCQPVYMTDVVIHWRFPRLYRGENVKIYVANTTGPEQLCHTIGGSSSYPSSIIAINCQANGRRLILRHANPCGECLLEICEVQILDCTAGTYGSDCSYQCGRCQGVACTRLLGNCPLGCLPGWRGFKCDVECASGTYGQDCSGQCGHCSDGAKCHHVTGLCLSGSCESGYGGDTCDQILSSASTVSTSTTEDKSTLLKGVGIGAGAVLGAVMLVGVVVLVVKLRPNQRAKSACVRPGNGAWGAHSASAVHPRFVAPQLTESNTAFSDDNSYEY